MNVIRRLIILVSLFYFTVCRRGRVMVQYDKGMTGFPKCEKMFCVVIEKETMV